MQALILAGGLGTRLRTLVNDRPKPMTILGGKPFLEHQIEYLKSHQIRKCILCVGYLHEHIQTYFGDGDKWGVKIDYSIEEDQLGTGGALRHARKYLKGTFLMLNGDSYCDVDLQKLMTFHKHKKKENTSYLGTIALIKVEDTRDYGSVALDHTNRILSFSEKSKKLNISNQINAGIYVLETEILNFIPSLKKVSLERETLPAVLKKGHHVHGYPSDRFFVDIGTPEGYYRFRNYLKERKP